MDPGFYAPAMPAQLISHYRIERRLGTGGMAEVFLAQDSKLERPVALKVMSAELAKDPLQRKRFRAEAKAASGLSHPHICVIHDVGETADGRPFLAMEYVEGETLDRVLQRRRLTVPEIIRLGIQTAEALEAAHSRGLIHRDIKPANLMLDQRGGVKVMDFGLAKRVAADDLSSSASSVAHTRTGMLIGTPQYMSPEQALGRELDPRTDIFSLGVVLYELAVGQRPFLGRTVGETINNVINQAPAPLELQDPKFSPGLDRIIFNCLEKEPQKRYRSADELKRDLRELEEAAARAPAVSGTTPKPTGVGAENTRPRGGFLSAAKRRLGRWLVPRNQEGVSTPPAAGLAAGSPNKSVAVLPFLNISANAADEYLSDGITEEIIIALSKIKGLKVPARTSCFAFKGKNEDIRRIGEQLCVNTVLEGSISKVGDKVRVSTQLINITDGFHMWSETYDRTLDDLLAIRTEVAASVAEALKGQLLGQERQELSKRGTEDAEAYRLYLQGRYLSNRRTREGMMDAIEHFNRALARDPSYAVAYAALAETYAVMSQYTGRPPRRAYAEARAAALKALELDESLAEPHAVLGHVKAYGDWDWAAGESEFRRAIALNPNYTIGYHWFGLFLGRLGRHDEALMNARRARELDPLSPLTNAGVGVSLVLHGQYEAAHEILREPLQRDPSFLVLHELTGFIYLFQGMLPEAMAAFETMHRLDKSGMYWLGELGFVYARCGREEEARKILERLRELQRQEYDMRLGIAIVQHGLGDHDGALESLNTVWEERALGVGWPYFDLCFGDLRGDPRFRRLLERAGLAH